jgi:hypothetical protein
VNYDSEGSDLGVTDVLPRNFSGGTESNNENLSSKMRSEDVPNTSQEGYRYANEFGDNAWRYTYIPSYAVVTRCLMKHGKLLILGYHGGSLLMLPLLICLRTVQCGQCCLHLQGQNDWDGCLHVYCIACTPVAR